MSERRNSQFRILEVETRMISPRDQKARERILRLPSEVSNGCLLTHKEFVENH